jgi:uridine phosphorylase
VTTLHVRPTAPLAERVLLPGDPGRALLLAQHLIDGPKMFNHHRGLWGYSGPALADGDPLTVQATGMGGPSAAIVIEELIVLGAKRLVRVGSCGALDDSLGLGDLVVAGEALAEDGASRALGATRHADADPALASRLGGLVGAAAGAVVSTDLFYAADAEAEGEARARWRAAGARAVEMECAALFRLGALRGVAAGAVLAVSDVLDGDEDRERIDDETLEAASRRMGEIAVAALEA